ncbi:MAG TPA: 3-phosphoshikimate 1-carboxyvinyltransferase [Candidatus Methylomirabilis sp.]|nr:3-phosphoshikimate 1-carboxyvinyltransferase [Candidatus Methylomirabilis sp.]
MERLTIRGPAPPLAGRLRVPGDKSITHRAILLGALADGTTEIRGYLAGEDCRRTAAACRALGVEVEGWGGPVLRVHGKGLHGLREAEGVLDAGNSGTTLRLLSGILAAQPFLSILTGDASLCQRPMGRIIGPLRQMGASIWGRAGDQYPPLAIRGGPLRGVRHESPVSSAQVKSALLLAGLYAEGPTTVVEPAPSRDHTERLLRGFGHPVEGTGRTATVAPARSLTAVPVEVPGDFSSAAFFLVAACLVPGSRVTLAGVGLNPTRTGLLDALQTMGATVEVVGRREVCGEPVGDLVVTAAPLRGASVGGPLIPRLIDEIPILAVAAACAEGETEIRDAGELRVKESDRIAALAAELGRLGVDVVERPDGLTIRGGRPLAGASCSSRGDHRIAMALAVAALVARGETRIADSACIGTSFPDFVPLLRTVAPVADARLETGDRDG